MNKLGTVLVFLTVFGLWRCSDADTLADEPPVEVAIQGQPTYENGIGELLKLKCGYCHAVPKPDIAPDDIVDDLDLNHYATRVVEGDVIRGADAIGRWLFEGILDQEVTKFVGTSEPRRMPLDYGTQLTEREKAFLELWSDEGSPESDRAPPPPGVASVGAFLYFDGGCQVCHSLGTGVELDDGEFLGPPFRPAAVTIAKIKSMWLHKVRPEPITTEEAADIQAYILQILGAN